MRTMLGFVALALLPFTANAEDFDYSYVELGFISGDLDVGGADVDGDGFGFNGSIAINKDYLLFAEYSSLGFDFSVDYNQLAIGGGRHFQLTPTIDIIGTVAFVDAEVDTGFGSVSEDGFGIGVGLRGKFETNLEWEAGIDYADIGDSNTSFEVAGRYYFKDTVAAGGGISFDDDLTVFSIGIRMEFGQ